MPKLHIGTEPRDLAELTRKLNSQLRLIEEALKTLTGNQAMLQSVIRNLHPDNPAASVTLAKPAGGAGT